MTRTHALIAAGIVVVAAAGIGAKLYLKQKQGTVVAVETIKTRDLDAVVSASGKIQPKRSVNISADTVGRVVDLAVNEGDRIRKGQFLLQIDPKSLSTRVESGAASLRAAEASLEQLRQAVETARVQLQQAQQTLKRQQDLWSQQLTTREALDKAQNDVEAAQSALAEREKQVAAQQSRIAQERATLESARYDLSKVRIESPIDGIVTRRNIEEGEMVMIGTMNNAGTVLLTLADMSIIEAQIEVDETSIPSVAIGQPAKVTIDALPDRTFKGHVTEIGNSPIQATPTTTGSTQATNFKVVVTLDDRIPEVRPGFTCTADITTAVRKNVVAVPIPAVAVRELVYDANGQIIRTPRTEKSRRTAEPVASAAELKPGQTRKEAEGVFVLRGGRAEFIPIKMGIAGEKYFEVLSGLKPNDQVITGPYNSVRGLAVGEPVRVEPPTLSARGASRQGSSRAMNNYWEAAWIALDAIWAAKLRSFMTVLGNIVAVTSIIAVVSLIQGLNASVKQAILNQAGADSFNIQQFPITRSDEEFEKVRGNPRITLADMRAIRRHAGGLISAVMADSSGAGRITYRDKSIDGTQIQGVTSDYVNFSSFDAERGRLMSPTEVDRARPVCVIGWQTADRLFGDSDPIDKVVQIEGVHFRVVGVSAKKGTLLGRSQDEFAVIPLTQFQMIFGSRRPLSVTIKPRDIGQIAQAMDDATIALRTARRLKPKQPDNFGIFTSDTILDIYHSATNGIFAVLIGVVALSLVVGGIVIMNIMLMVVSERTREIGLRKALGARRSDIATQILTESVVLSLFGGVVGTLLGATIANVIAALTPVPAKVEPWSVALGISITALVGLFFGLYPAMRAARLDPIEALRRE